MMEEIDRFQVPPVNGETQPLVRDERQIPPPKKQNHVNQFLMEAKGQVLVSPVWFYSDSRVM